VAEHRERVLAGGRRFKYPVQYAKHRLVINTIVISIFAIIFALILIWWQLYQAQNTSSFFYRITRVVPLPVASVQEHAVPYSDYLSGFRSQEHYLQNKEGVNLYSKENKKQLEWIKRQSLNDAIADAYAAKIASDKKIKVTSKQVDDAILRQRKAKDGLTSKESYDAIVLDHFNWTPEEAREVTERKLLRQEVAYVIDDIASQLKELVQQKIATETDFDKLAATVNPVEGVKIEAGMTPLVPQNNQDGGLAEAATKLSIGQVSAAFRSTIGDGYYFVKPLQKDSKRVSYAYLKIPLTVFQKKLEKVKTDKQISEFISIPEVRTPTN
jgi:hypothetical protein